MSLINLFNKGNNKKVVNPWGKPDFGCREKRLAPVKLTGVVIPCNPLPNAPTQSNFKLVCPNGLECYFSTDKNWSTILNRYSWDEVKVIGLVNKSNLSLIPQKIYPKQPIGKRQKIIDLIRWKNQNIAHQFAKQLNHSLATPAALPAIVA